MKLRGRTYRIHRDNFLLFNPREEHIEIYESERPTHSHAVVFADETLASVLGEAGVEASELVFDRVSETVDSLLASNLQLLFSLRESGSETRLAFECLAVDLIMAILDRYPSSASARLRKESNRGTFPSNIARAQKIMARNLSNPEFNLDQLAQDSGISKFHLIRCFKNRTGVSPLKYLRIVRLEIAKSMLVREGSVSNVAMATGFGSFSAFNKAFKKSAGCAPKEFRKHVGAVKVREENCTLNDGSFTLTY